MAAAPSTRNSRPRCSPNSTGRHQTPTRSWRRALLHPNHAVYIARRDADACTALAERSGLTAVDCLAMAAILAAKDDPTTALTWVERGLRIESSSGYSRPG